VWRRSCDALSWFPVATEILLAQAGLVSGRVRLGRVRHRLDGAVIDDIEGKQIAPQTTAHGDPRHWLQVEVEIQANIAEPRGEIRLYVIGMPGGRLDTALRRADEIAAGVVADLQLLGLMEDFTAEPAGPARPQRELHGFQLNEIAPLSVRALGRLLGIEQEAGEVLA
jgi:hypothetical protein